MKKLTSTTKKHLKWFLSLINANIDSFSNREVFNIWVELRDIAYGSLGILAIQDTSLVKWEARRQQLREIQKGLRDLLGNVHTAMQKPKKVMIRPLLGPYDLQEKAYEELEKEGIAHLEPVLSCIVSSLNDGKDLPKWLNNWIASTYCLETKVLVSDNRLYLFAPQLENKLRQDFLELLSQIPLNMVQICQREDCQGYFLKATKKEKRYCSNKCAWVMASRIRRSVQPEREKEKKRASYERKKKKELGPKVKVKKRQ